jgi:hypothetical protein
MVLSKGERLAIAFLLFGLAFLIFGIRKNNALTGYRYAKKMTEALKNAIEFAETNFRDVPNAEVGFNVYGNKDVIHINRLNNRITSERNFVYNIKGYKIICSVNYDSSGKYYLISCQSE